MEGNDELQKKARPGELAIKGTVTPDVTTEPVAPARPIRDDLDLKMGDRGPSAYDRHRDPGDESDAT